MSDQIFQKDVNSLRLKIFLEILQEEKSQNIISDNIHALNHEERDLLRDLKHTKWIQSSIELSIIHYFCKKINNWNILKKVGGDALATAFEFLLPSFPEKITTHDIVYRIPSAVSLFLTYINISIQKKTNDTFMIHLLHTDSDKWSIVDIHFIKGIIYNLFDSLKSGPVQLRTIECNEHIAGDFSEEKISISQNPDECTLKLSITRISGDDNDAKEDKKFNTYDAYISSVIQRSSQLLQDKKELLTAVEYLQLANDKLEKELDSNKRELYMARNIQKGFVPKRIPDWKGLQFWIKFFPLAEVSGDFYDYMNLEGDRLGILVADVSGHGVPAALISAIAKLSFQNHVLDSPSDIFTKVNLDLLRYVKREGYLTGSYFIVDKNYNVRYSLAGSPRPILFRKRNNEVIRLPGTGTILGMFPDANELFMDQVTHLEPGDKLFVFTDGLVEATDSNDTIMGDDILIEFIRETKGMNIQESSNHVMKRYNEYILGSEAHDDLTFLTIMLSERINEFEELIQESKKEFNKGNIAKAIELLKQGVEIFPRHATTLFTLGKYLSLNKDYENAIHFLNEYNILQPYNADAYTILAHCHYKKRNFPVALDEAKRSLSLRSDNPNAMYLLIKIYLSLGKKDSAFTTLTALEFLKPDHKKLRRLKNKYFD